MLARRRERPARDQRPIEGREARAVPEDIAANGVYAIEEPMAAGKHAGELEPGAPRQRPHERPPRFEQRASARRLERHQRPPGIVAARLRDLCLSDAEAGEVLLRKVNA